VKLQYFFDFIILVGSIQGFFLAFLIWRTTRFHKTANRFLSISIFAFSLNNAIDILTEISFFQQNQAISLLPLRWTFLIPVSLYFYIIYLIQSSRKFTYKDFLLFIPFVIQFTVQTIQYISSFFWSGNANYWFVSLNKFLIIYNSFEEYLSISFTLIFLIASLIELKVYEALALNNHSNLAKRSLSWLFRLMKILFLLWILWVLPYLINQFLNSYSEVTHYPLWIAISILNYWICYSAIFKEDLFQAVTEIKSNELSKQDLSSNSQQLYESLLDNLVKHKLFLDPDLNLQFLADKHGVSTGHLSRVINHYYKNSFYHLVNSYRIEEVKNMLLDKQYNHLSILGIAFDCGFNSKSTFNSVFNQFTGLTPSAFKKGAMK
jgi:AraC-like DNA-binding protein